MSESEALSERLDRLFAALGNRHRRAILDRLLRGPARVTDLAEPFDLSLNAVSKHLKVLEEAALVRREQRGREYHFRVQQEPVLAARQWLHGLKRPGRRSSEPSPGTVDPAVPRNGEGSAEGLADVVESIPLPDQLL